MAKLLSLDKFWLEQTRDLLSFSPGLGTLLYEAVDLDAGVLKIWVPEQMNELPAQNLRHDLLYHDESFGLWEDLCSFISLFLQGSARKFIVAKTSRNRLSAKLRADPQIPWFSFDSPDRPGDLSVCVYLTGLEATVGNYDELFAEASPYPETVILASLQSDVNIRSGDHLALRSASLKALIDGVEHILLGVFDERSYMVWSRP